MWWVALYDILCLSFCLVAPAVLKTPITHTRSLLPDTHVQGGAGRPRRSMALSLSLPLSWVQLPLQNHHVLSN